MLQPARTKYRKQQKNINKKLVSTKGTDLAFGEYGLKCLGNFRLSALQIESSRIVISKHLKRGGKIWIRVFPDRPITKKPIEVRQGKGKGDIEYWAVMMTPGKILFEISGIPEEMALKALKLASYKLPTKTIIVSRKYHV
ncbi:MAG: 50S ribosomal protein L16 [Candidatus Riesia sp.]|nr:50S ribosomal protein L16 [Candidatus Riesia sp.]